MIWWTVAFWAFITTVIAAIWTVMEGETPLIFALMVQSGAAIMGVLTALPLRLAGYRSGSHPQRPTILPATE